MQVPAGAGTVGIELQDVPISKPPRIDGRRLRSERTKQLIIEAFLSLLRDNSQMPTAVQIAERAGYSVRSIFERFPDLNALRVAATDYQLAQALALAPPRGADGNRETRLRSQVNTRAHTCERGVALWRVLLQFADQDPTGAAQAARSARPGDDGRTHRADVPCRIVDVAGRRAPPAPDCPRGADRHGELGAYARAARPVVRRSLRSVDPRDRPAPATDADCDGRGGLSRWATRWSTLLLRPTARVLPARRLGSTAAACAASAPGG